MEFHIEKILCVYFYGKRKVSGVAQLDTIVWASFNELNINYIAVNGSLAKNVLLFPNCSLSLSALDAPLSSS